MKLGWWLGAENPVVRNLYFLSWTSNNIHVPMVLQIIIFRNPVIIPIVFNTNHGYLHRPLTFAAAG